MVMSVIDGGDASDRAGFMIEDGLNHVRRYAKLGSSAGKSSSEVVNHPRCNLYPMWLVTAFLGLSAADSQHGFVQPTPSRVKSH